MSEWRPSWISGFFQNLTKPSKIESKAIETNKNTKNDQETQTKYKEAFVQLKTKEIENFEKNDCQNMVAMEMSSHVDRNMGKIPPGLNRVNCWASTYTTTFSILVARDHDPFGQHQGSRPLAGSNTGSPQFTYSLSNLANLIGLNYNRSVLGMPKKIGSGPRS